MEAPHDPLYAGFHPTGHPMGPLGLIEPLDPLVLDAKKVRAFFLTQQVWSFYNCVGMCDFVGTPLNALTFEPLVDYVNSVTGWNMSLFEMMKVGERANTMMRLFNCREGFTTSCPSGCTRASATESSRASASTATSSWPRAGPTTRWRAGIPRRAGRPRPSSPSSASNKQWGQALHHQQSRPRDFHGAGQGA
jgi:hypothetical protein